MITKTEIHLSDFRYLKGGVNKDYKLRFSLTLILYTDDGEPYGLTMTGCVAYVNHLDRLTWHPPAIKTRGIYAQQVTCFTRLHDAVVTQLARTKYVKHLRRAATAYFEMRPGELDEELLTESAEINETL